MGKTKVNRISSQPSTVQIMTDQEQLENVEYFSYLGSMITNSARSTGALKCRTVTVKAAFNKKQNLCTSRFDLNLRKKLVICHTWSTALCASETLIHFGKQIRNTWEVLKCGAGKGWRRSAGQIV